jgi:hypothetical protein
LLNEEGQERIDEIEAHHHEELGNEYCIEILLPLLGNHWQMVPFPCWLPDGEISGVLNRGKLRQIKLVSVYY